MKIINLDENVVSALDFFAKNKPPKFQPSRFKMPFVVGSEGAFFTGKNIFSRQAAIFANESTFQKTLKSYAFVIKKGLVKQAVVISASGEKDAIWEVNLAKKYGLKTTLLTCNSQSSAARLADKVFAFRKTAEPYTYNFSTYFGMMIASTGEDPREIKNFLKKIKTPQNYGSYRSYSFILPNDYLDICNLIVTKGEEMFGPRLCLRSFTSGRARHAKFVVRWNKELVISFDEKNKFFGDARHRWNIKIPSWANIATMMALGYYLVGKIQATKPPYFKQNIAAYCRDYGPRAYDEKKSFSVIVPGN